MKSLLRKAQARTDQDLRFRSRVTRSTLARANEELAWQLFAALTGKLMARARHLYRDAPSLLDLAVSVYAVDSTLIDLSLALCRGPTGTARMHR